MTTHLPTLPTHAHRFLPKGMGRASRTLRATPKHNTPSYCPVAHAHQPNCLPNIPKTGTHTPPHLHLYKPAHLPTGHPFQGCHAVGTPLRGRDAPAGNPAARRRFPVGAAPCFKPCRRTCAGWWRCRPGGATMDALHPTHTAHPHHHWRLLMAPAGQRKGTKGAPTVAEVAMAAAAADRDRIAAERAQAEERRAELDAEYRGLLERLLAGSRLVEWFPGAEWRIVAATVRPGSLHAHQPVVYVQPTDGSLDALRLGVVVAWEPFVVSGPATFKGATHTIAAAQLLPGVTDPSRVGAWRRLDTLRGARGLGAVIADHLASAQRAERGELTEVTD